jgi:hypothetical protein
MTVLPHQRLAVRAAIVEHCAVTGTQISVVRVLRPAGIELVNEEPDLDR